MHIKKQNNGTWKVEIKKENKIYYLKEFKDAIKLAFQLGGLIND